METWPELAFEQWKETRNTLHLWTQVVGKVKLELCPFLIHPALLGNTSPNTECCYTN